MQREPDWQALNEFNFLLYSRIADALNAALSAMTIAEMPDSGGRTPKWWYDRSQSKVELVLNTVMAWSWLIQYKTGIDLTEKVIRPFYLQNLLDWLSLNLQLAPPLIVKEDMLIAANQQTLQESLMLLHSVASTQGSGVVFSLETDELGVNIRVRFVRLRAADPFDSVDDMLAAQGSHWRQQAIAFELAVARDFLRMNNLYLDLEDNGSVGEFAFYVYQAGKQPPASPGPALDKHTKRMIKHITQSMLPVMSSSEEAEDTRRSASIDAKQRWHTPHQRFVERLRQLQAEIKSRPTQTTIKPRRPGGWHTPHPTQPRISRTSFDDDPPIIVSVNIPEPALPPDFKVKSRRLDIARETQNMQRIELNDPGDVEREAPFDHSFNSEYFDPDSSDTSPIDTSAHQSGGNDS